MQADTHGRRGEVKCRLMAWVVDTGARACAFSWRPLGRTEREKGVMREEGHTDEDLELDI